MFTVDVSIATTHTLKTSGLYKIVRHPSYLGLMLIITGLGLSDGSILSFIVVVASVFLAMNYRMAVEEQALIAEFGTQYEDYKKRVSRIVPWIY
jgi:protein-S-isoprenylcysteine O-methyltransferase Ste14